MSDESIIVKDNGSIFLGGPPLVKAATGEDVSIEDLGGAEVHTRTSGVCDHFAETEEHALQLAREVVAHLGDGPAKPPRVWEGIEPLYPGEDLYGIIPKDSRHPYDVREVIARLLDGSQFHEFKKRFGSTLVCGFGEMFGEQVGVIANNGVLFSESAQKGAHFIQLCWPAKDTPYFFAKYYGFYGGSQV